MVSYLCATYSCTHGTPPRHPNRTAEHYVKPADINLGTDQKKTFSESFRLCFRQGIVWLRLASISPLSWGWLWTSSPLASASQVLGLQARTTTPSLYGAGDWTQDFRCGRQAFSQLNYLPILKASDISKQCHWLCFWFFKCLLIPDFGPGPKLVNAGTKWWVGKTR